MFILALRATSKLEKIIGGKEKSFSLTGKTGFRYDFMVNAETLASHLKPSQLPFLPMLPEIMENPAEVWLSFEMNKKLGNTVLRTRFVKAIDYGLPSTSTETPPHRRGKEKGMLAVFQASGGFLESWTLVPARDLSYLNNQRVGKLIWKR